MRRSVLTTTATKERPKCPRCGSDMVLRRANILSNKVSNTRRFRRVERGIQRNVRTGVLWFVGRQGGKVIWKRLGTPDLRVARSTVAKSGSYNNGNMEISLLVDEKGQPVHGGPTATPAASDQLPRCPGCCEGYGVEACSVNHASGQLRQSLRRPAEIGSGMVGKRMGTTETCTQYSDQPCYSVAVMPGSTADQ